MDLDRVGQHLRHLASSARFFDFANRGDATAGGQGFDILFVIRHFSRRDDLDVALAGAVVDFDETETSFRIPPSPDPALEFSVFADGRFLPRVGDR